jgi:hypothetical protein
VVVMRYYCLCLHVMSIHTVYAIIFLGMQCKQYLGANILYDCLKWKTKRRPTIHSESHDKISKVPN